MGIRNNLMGLWNSQTKVEKIFTIVLIMIFLFLFFSMCELGEIDKRCLLKFW